MRATKPVARDEGQPLAVARPVDIDVVAEARNVDIAQVRAGAASDAGGAWAGT